MVLDVTTGSCCREKKHGTKLTLAKYPPAKTFCVSIFFLKESLVNKRVVQHLCLPVSVRNKQKFIRTDFAQRCVQSGPFQEKGKFTMFIQERSDKLISNSEKKVLELLQGSLLPCFHLTLHNGAATAIFPC